MHASSSTIVRPRVISLLTGEAFYLVDVRDAKFDARPKAHLLQCGAIMKTRAV